MDLPRKTPSSRDGILAKLPEAIRNLPTLEYRRRTARTRDESLSDVEYGVETSRDLSQRFAKRKK